MSSKREQILSAAKSALSSISGVPNTSIYRSRVSALLRKEFPAIIIEPLTDVCERGTVSKLDWTLTFQIWVLLLAQTADQSADIIISDIHSKIMSDSTLTGLVVDLEPSSVDWQFSDADGGELGYMKLTFIAKYQSGLTDLTI